MKGDVVVVVLAGGDGRRIGGNKPLLELGGERLIDRALQCARRWSDLVAIAVRNPEQVELVDAPILTDDPEIAGPLAGLASALAFGDQCGREFVLAIPADMPFLPPDLLDRLLLGIGKRACTIASSGGHLHPVCGLWRTSARRQLTTYLTGERRSLRGFAELIGLCEVEWPSAPHDAFFNVNTVGDLAEAARRASSLEV